MQSFRYEDMRVRYRFMLGIAILTIVQYSLSFVSRLPKTTSSLAYVVTAAIVTVVIALRGLNRGIKFRETGVTIDGKQIRFAEINSIQADKNNFALNIKTSEPKPFAVTIGTRESTGDIGQFRAGMRELFTRLKAANPKAQISNKAEMSVTPGSKEYDSAEKSIQEEQGKLKGVGGWLLFILLSIIALSSPGILLPFGVVTKIVYFPETGTPSQGDIIQALLYLTYLPWAIVLLISLLKHKAVFSKQYLAFWIFQFAASTITEGLKYIIVDGYWPGVLACVNLLVLGTARSIAWYFAWREYFRRSIRVRNTFHVSVNSSAATDT